MTALRRWSNDRRAYPIGLFVLLVVVVYVDGRLSMAFIHFDRLPGEFPLPSWLDAYARWDSGWYHSIAERGYFYDGPGRQSSVAFFPAYPTAMRIVGTLLLGNLAVAGIVVTLAAGFGIALLFHRWVEAFLGPRTARLALALLFCYPFAFYLFGVIYSDALFVVAVIGAFSLLERDRPWLAGLVGIVATADRPVGISVVVGLVVRSLEIHGVLPGAPAAAMASVPAAAPMAGVAASTRPGVRLLPRSVALRRLSLRALVPAVSVLGLLAYCALLWVRFDDPLAFTRVSTAPGWGKAVNLETLAKLHLFRLLGSYGLNLVTFWLVVQGLYAIVALGLVPAVVRRFGWGYGAYLAVSVGIAFVSTRDFIGMGRYVLAGFPAFAAAADLLLGGRDRRDARPRRLASIAVLVNAGLLLWMVSLFARWYFLS